MSLHKRPAKSLFILLFLGQPEKFVIIIILPWGHFAVFVCYCSSVICVKDDKLHVGFPSTIYATAGFLGSVVFYQFFFPDLHN